jgi:hypothetical protein
MRHPPPRLASLGTSGAAAALLIGFTLSGVLSAQPANAQQLRPYPTCETCIIHSEVLSPQETTGFTTHL